MKQTKIITFSDGESFISFMEHLQQQYSQESEFCIDHIVVTVETDE